MNDVNLILICGYKPPTILIIGRILDELSSSGVLLLKKIWTGSLTLNVITAYGKCIYGLYQYYSIQLNVHDNIHDVMVVFFLFFLLLLLFFFFFFFTILANVSVSLLSLITNLITKIMMGWILFFGKPIKHC